MHKSKVREVRVYEEAHLIRHATWLLVNNTRSRKHIISSQKFNNDLFPLNGDKFSGKEITEEQVAATWTKDKWDKFLTKKVVKKESIDLGKQENEAKVKHLIDTK